MLNRVTKFLLNADTLDTACRLLAETARVDVSELTLTEIPPAGWDGMAVSKMFISRPKPPPVDYDTIDPRSVYYVIEADILDAKD